MGDMGDVFRDMSAFKKQKKSQRLQNFRDHPLSKSDLLKEQTPYHYKIMVKDKVCDYWPSTSKWMWDHKMFYGVVTSFVKWLQIRGVEI